MDIIVAGGGKTGLALVQQLVAEGHNITLIDDDNRVLETAVERYDAMGVCGNCASKEVLLQAGVEEAELVIAVTDADEVNLLSCMTAHGINDKVHTIARIRNPQYAEQVMIAVTEDYKKQKSRWLAMEEPQQVIVVPQSSIDAKRLIEDINNAIDEFRTKINNLLTNYQTKAK